MLYQDYFFSQCSSLQKIREFHRINETVAMQYILPLARVSSIVSSKAWERARKMVLAIRQEQKAHAGVDALLNEFSLSTSEGIVLMCLAEALLRVPDTQTQDELIRDKLSKGEWAPHLGNSDSMFVNASAWGLLFTGNVVSYSDEKKQSQIGLLKKTMGRLGEPVIRKAMNIAMKVMGKQFVMGETIEQACERANEKQLLGYVYSYDMLGEGARTEKDAERYFQSYIDAVDVIGRLAEGKGPIKSSGISVKLSAIYPRYDLKQYALAVPIIKEKLKQLCLQAKHYNIGLTVDAEESERLDISLDIIESVFSDPELDGWTGFGIAIQAYQKRAIHVIDWIRNLTKKYNKKIMVRLVKGAYWDTEIKHSQQGGYNDFPVFTRKSSTDVCYQACAIKLLGYRDTIYPQFATHNAYSAAIILELVGDDKTGFEFQCLHGMGDTLYDQIVKQENIPCRIYAPVGQHEDLLAYLVRRLLENGANSSFVNAIVDESKRVEDLLVDPVDKTLSLKVLENPQIVNPIELYAPQRKNSLSLDLYGVNTITETKDRLESWYRAFKNLHSNSDKSADMEIKNPANLEENIGFLRFDTAEEMLEKLKLAENSYQHWSAKSSQQRAEIINRLADLLEKNIYELIGLCIKEAGKVPQDAIDEVREAVDFCRYYAACAINSSQTHKITGRGVVLCISPWNFPLAIFLGQVVAALVSGNTVIAKPAEQTSLIASYARKLLKQAGLPDECMQIVIGTGPLVGDTLLLQNTIAAVIFTGSTTTAHLIAKLLAKRGCGQIPFIAETGGQNCMIVDSTALPEQVVDDIITSAFQSAGQRCSALRVLYLQNEIADNVISMLIGAMQKLVIGDPQWLATDVGPVIDKKALNALNQHITAISKKGTLLYKAPLDESLNGYYFPPQLIEIDNINQLDKEVFGPVVHVIRYRASELDQVIDEINATGFGLTMGIHSRIEEKVAQLTERSNAGNIYVNRNMIGAVVGGQPFGGRGLSGTGPKAGGPDYLNRLMIEESSGTERLLHKQSEINITCAGDNEIVCSMVEEAGRSMAIWQKVPVLQKLSKMRQFIAELVGLEIAQDVVNNHEFEEMMSILREQLIDIEKRLLSPGNLPGPTGESNQLLSEPRGILIAVVNDNTSFEFWLLSLVIALSTGNALIASVDGNYLKKVQGISGLLETINITENIFQYVDSSQTRELLTHPKIAGVVVGAEQKQTALMAQIMAEREGGIIPLITLEQQNQLFKRLTIEKTISIDTTAAGGNTSLMMLDEDIC